MPDTLLPAAEPLPATDLTTEQAAAKGAAVRFLTDGQDDELRMGGYAGTGKTTVIKSIIRELGDMRIAVAALSGKAVSVLRRKGVTDAQTIHKTIYDFDPTDRTFYRKNHLPADAVIVDEASMIDRTLYDDLRAFKLPVLFVGDMGQLEPVGRDINLMAEDRLDVRLTQIHRQAEGNPIVEFSVVVRTGGTFEHGEFDTVSIGGEPLFWRRLAWADQIICGKNSRRHRVNQRVRFDQGRGGQPLTVGEKLICIQNNKDFGVFNGMILYVDRVRSESQLNVYADLRTEDGDRRHDVPVRKDQLGKDRGTQAHYHQESILCDYGYCITCHKAQGSEWDKVLVLEDCAKWDMNRWRYTAVTRAAAELVYCY